MLSKQARVTVEATLPAVADNIEEIDRRFYDHMFAARPDLMDGLFTAATRPKAPSRWRSQAPWPLSRPRSCRIGCRSSC